MAAIKKANTGEDGLDGNVILGSADVDALYPSIDTEFSAQITAEMFMSSDIKVESID